MSIGRNGPGGSEGRIDSVYFLGFGGCSIVSRIKERVKLSIVSCWFLIFTFFVFGTLEFHMSNREEFWFSYGHILPSVVLICILVIAVCITILLMVPDSFFKYGIALLNGFTLALYFQGNFLPNDYGVLDGTAIEWGNYQGRLAYNSIIWSALILLSILFANKYEKIYFSVSRVVIGIILVTQIVTLITVGFMLPKRDNDSVLSVEGQFEASKNNNTIVFVLDAFDAELFCELLQENPSDIQEMFEDFTFYHNTVGGATRTKYAIPYIFTGRTNTGNDSYKEYLEKSFNESSLIQELKTDKYDARLYTGSSYIDMQQTEAIDNIESDRLHPTSEWGLTKDFLKLTAFRYAPHVMKKYFWMYSGDFDLWKESNTVYAFNDSKFYEKLVTERINASIDQDVFRFYHLTGAHEPYTMNEKCEKVELGKGSEFGQALGSLRIVTELCRQLKELGIYEDSTIFVIADHGARNYEQNPLFMVKTRGMQKHFQQSEIPLSYKDFSDMLNASLAGQKIDIEKDYICLGERYFYVGNEENNKINIVEYASEGLAYDPTSFYLTGQVFKGNTKYESYGYQIGEKLSFKEEATANFYCKSGFYKNEATHTWVGEGGSAEMYFELVGKYDDLLLELEYGTYAPPQEVKIYANGNMIAEYVASGQEQKQIKIPKEYMEDDKLSVKFEFPNTVSPAELKESSDKRKLALCMYGVCISSAKDEE